MSERKVRFAVIGLGSRGYGMLRDVILNIDDADIVAVCDLYEDRVERARAEIEKKRAHSPFASTDYNEVLKREDVDIVYVATSWETHVEIGIAAMRCGKPVGIEVGGAYSVE